MTPDSTTSPSAGTGDALREALAQATAFCAHNRADPLAIRFEFSSERDRLAAADAVDQAYLIGIEGIRAFLPQDRGGEADEALVQICAYGAYMPLIVRETFLREAQAIRALVATRPASPSRVGVPDDVDVRAKALEDMRHTIHNDAVLFEIMATRLRDCWQGTGASSEDGSASNDYRVWMNEAHNRARDLRYLLRDLALAHTGPMQGEKA